MIIFRYLARQVLTTMLAVSFVLLLIIVSGRFIKYLAEAASGGIAADVLFALLGYKMPEYLGLILPLGLFLGILMTYGRLYVESEMTVLSACGMSYRRLMVYSLIPALGVSLLVGFFSLWLGPWGAQKVDGIFRIQNTRTEFDTLAAGRFQTLGAGDRVTYTERLSNDRKVLQNVFISQRTQKKGADPQITLLVAEQAFQEIDASGSRFLLLKNGYQYDGQPGDLDYRVIQYDEYGIRLPQRALVAASDDSELKTTGALWASDSLADVAQLQWRLSMPLLVPIVVMMAVPLSRVNPRQGRYLRLLPAILLYMGYLVILSATRSSIEEGGIVPALGLWWVHGLFFTIALLLIANMYRHLPLFMQLKNWLLRRPE